MVIGQSWEEGLKTGLCFVKENKKLIYHVYNSLHRETIERYLYSVSLDFACKFIDNVSKSLKLSFSDDDKKFIASSQRCLHSLPEHSGQLLKMQVKSNEKTGCRMQATGFLRIQGCDFLDF